MRLPITGAGLVTALGFGASGTCAGLCTGVSLPREIVRSIPDDEALDAPEVSAAGYPVHDFAEGFFQTGAWVRLASGAVEDLIHRAELPAPPGDLWSSTVLAGVIPLVTAERFLWTLDNAPEAPQEAFLEPLAELTPGLSTSGAFWSAAGHVSLAAALLQVERALGARSADRFLLVGADSFVDDWSLAFLTGAQRLKNPDHPTGMMPGEAGAALLVESETATRLRRAEILGFVEAVAVAGPIPRPAPAPEKNAGSKEEEEEEEEEETGDDEGGWLPPAAPALGRNIALAIRQVLPRSGGPWRGDLYLDLNGEYWRAEAWGHATVHLAGEIDPARTLIVAESLGETGAASAPIALTWALWNFGRDRTQSALVVSVGEDGAVGAIRLAPPEPG
jgi:3-oxoacyl-[acyl-carrier-protein] synthase-1